MLYIRNDGTLEGGSEEERAAYERGRLTMELPHLNGEDMSERAKRLRNERAHRRCTDILDEMKVEEVLSQPTAIGCQSTAEGLVSWDKTEGLFPVQIEGSKPALSASELHASLQAKPVIFRGTGEVTLEWVLQEDFSLEGFEVTFEGEDEEVDPFYLLVSLLEIGSFSIWHPICKVPLAMLDKLPAQVISKGRRLALRIENFHHDDYDFTIKPKGSFASDY